MNMNLSKYDSQNKTVLSLNTSEKTTNTILYLQQKLGEMVSSVNTSKSQFLESTHNLDKSPQKQVDI